MEDFGDDASAKDHRLPAVAPDVTAAGTALVEEMLRAWADAPDLAEEDDVENKDVVMKDVDGIEAPHGTDTHDQQWQRELRNLRKVYQEFRPQLDANEWVRVVLSQTY